jgi:hypothetical protein
VFVEYWKFLDMMQSLDSKQETTMIDRQLPTIVAASERSAPAPETEKKEYGGHGAPVEKPQRRGKVRAAANLTNFSTPSIPVVFPSSPTITKWWCIGLAFNCVFV